MAWSKASVPLADRTYLSAGKPMLVAGNALSASVTPEWNSDTGSFAETDRTDAAYPARRAYDGHLNSDTRTATSGTTIYFLFALDPTVSIDFALVTGMPTWDALVDIELQIADGSTFAGATTIKTWSSVLSDPRLYSFDLRDGLSSVAQRYSGAAYGRLKITRQAGGTLAPMPALTEVFLGQRTQLAWKPNEPWVSLQERDECESFQSKTGDQIDYERWSGQRIVRAGFTVLTDADDAAIRTWWRNTKARRRTVWIEDPGAVVGTDKALPCWMVTPKTFSIAFVGGPEEREWTLELDEAPPFVSGE